MPEIDRIPGRKNGLYVLIRALLMLAPLFLPWIVFSQGKPMAPKDISVLRTRVKEAARATTTLACNFVQEKEMGMIAEKITSRGKFLLKKDKKLRWEYTEPFIYIIVIDHDQIAVKDENKVSRFSLQSNKVFLEVNRVILGSLQGTLLEDERNFSAAFYESKGGWMTRLSIRAPRLKETLDWIDIWFNRNDFTVDRLEMHEAGGDVTRITFSDKKLNQPIADEKFVVH
ncbi:MAG TPA: outer membrane lipoprotein carrier protein LolA [Bacteroidales bacterium]|nr:outer membrane lipoprotein carrier protein LolA [Bacteroidales bacterium]